MPARKYALGFGLSIAVVVVLLAAIVLPRWRNRNGDLLFDGKALAVPQANTAQTTSTNGAPELDLETGHSGFVGSIAFSPDGQLLASSGQEGTVKLWDLRRRRELRSFPFARSQVGQIAGTPEVAFSPDGRWLRSRIDGIQHGGTGGFWAWDIATGREGTLGVSGEQWSADGQWVTAIGPEGVIVGNTSTREVSPWFARQHEQIVDLVFSPDNRWLAVAEWESLRPSADYQKFKAAYDLDRGDAVVQVWEMGTWRKVCTVAAPRPLNGVPVFSPDGRWLALVAIGRKTVELRDVEKGCDLRTLSGASELSVLTFSPDSRLLAGSAKLNRPAEGLPTLVLWNLATGEVARTLTTGPIVSLSFSQDSGTLAAAGDDGVRSWDATSGWSEATRLDEGSASAVAFGPDGRIAWAWRGGLEIRIREPAGDGKPERLMSQVQSVASVALSADGRWLGATGGLGGFQLWDLTAGRGAQSLPIGPVHGISFTTESRGLLTLGRHLAAWDVVDLQNPKDFEPDIGVDDSSLIAFSRDGRLMVAGSNKEVRIRDIAARTVRTLPTDEMILAVAITAGGDLIATATGDGAAVVMGVLSKVRPAVTVWNTATGREVRRWEKAASAVALSADGRWIAIAAGSGQAAFQLWDVTSEGEPLLVGEKRAGLLGGVTAVEFSDDSRFVAFGDFTHEIQIWDVVHRLRVGTLVGHTSQVTDLVFSSDGHSLVSGSHDGTVRLWTLPEGKLVATLLSFRNSDDWLVVTPDGLFDGSPGGWNHVSWRFGQNTFDSTPVETFFAEFYHPGLLAEVFNGKRPNAPRDLAQIDRRQPVLRLSMARASNAPGAIETRMVRIRLDVAEAAADSSRVAGTGARDVRLFRNGSLVKAWRGEVLAAGRRRVTLQADVPVAAGINHFTAYAFNRDNVKSEDAALMLTGADSLARAGTAYVIAVGVNQYANPTFNLKYAVADAERFAEQVAIEQRRIGRFESIQVVPLLDRDATKDNILRVFNRLAGVTDLLPATGPVPAGIEELTPSDPEYVVFIFFAGHGVAEGARFYLVPHDLGYGGARDTLDADAVRAIAAHSISDQELERALESVDARQLVLIIEACHSGQALEAQEKRRGPMNSKGLAQLAYEKGMYVLTAAQSYQAALETERLGHGFLTYALVETGLASGGADYAPKDGSILLREWLDFAAARVPELQLDLLQQPRSVKLVFVGGEENLAPPKRSLQRPRVYYRRELESQPIVVASR